MGNTCKPMAVSFQCMTKFTTNKKKKCYVKAATGILSGAGSGRCGAGLCERGGGGKRCRDPGGGTVVMLQREAPSAVGTSYRSRKPGTVPHDAEASWVLESPRARAYVQTSPVPLPSDSPRSTTARDSV